MRYPMHKMMRTLSSDGKKEIGDIFKGCVPLTQWTPVKLNENNISKPGQYRQVE